MRLLLVGNYGVGNLGDEVLKEYFLRQFPEVEWLVVSANPLNGEYNRLPAGFRSFLRPWWRTIGAMRKSDGIVFGGGSLFTDTESVFACFLWCWHAFVARIFRKKIHLAFQGIGPFKTRLGKWCSRWVIARATSISVRDLSSKEQIELWEKNTKVVQTSDPVISLIQAENMDGSSKNVFIIIPRKNSTERFINKVCEWSKEREWDSLRILSLQPEDGEEQKMCRRINQVCGGEAEMRSVKTLADLSREVAQGSIVLSQRYHGALAAIALGKDFEVVEQKEGDKLSYLRGKSREELLGLVNIGEETLRMVWASK
ncbi:polysaccharide pyruvyl transferase family protein [Patescibacteria group bacterium]|nr:polysaccharide pyruvyl transferase family protein [Patescibacteria group bacterium]